MRDAFRVLLSNFQGGEKKGIVLNYKLVFRLLGRLMLIVAALMVPSLIVALIYGGGDALSFVYTILITAACGAALNFLLKPQRSDLTARDGMAVAGLSWIVLSFFGALPFWISGAIPYLADAYFESVSGFTTTGSTILTEIEHLPKGILFWLASMYNAYCGYCVLDHSVVERFLGISYETARSLWRKCMSLYLDTEDEARIQSVEDKAKIIGYTRIMRRTIRRGGLDTEDGKAQIEYCRAALSELLPKVDTLLF